MTLQRCVFWISTRQWQDWAQREQECEHRKTRQMGWPSRKSRDHWVDLELNKILIWAEPTYSQALLCGCCSVDGGCQHPAPSTQCFTDIKKREDMGKHHCHLFTERILLSAAASEEGKAIYISLISDWESKLQSHSSWLLRTMLSLELIFLLWERQQDMNCVCTATTALWPPPDRVMLFYKGGVVNTERNTTARRQVGEKSSVNIPECPSPLGSETRHV